MDPCRGYLRYWGKANPATGGFHLASFHCLDVAAVAEQLLRGHRVLRARFAQLLSVTEDHAVTLLTQLAAMHDFGKFDARFQAKAPEAAGALNPAWREVAGETFDHGTWGYHHLLAEEALVRELLGPAVLPLLQAACGHHGALPSHRRPDTRPLRADLREADGAARRGWLRDCIDVFGARGNLWWDGSLGAAAVELFAGFVAVSDWIGSQEKYFSYRADPMPLEGYYEGALCTAERALSEIGFLPSPPSGAPFRALFPGYEPRDVQRITENLSPAAGACLVVIEAQMGAGKTEAALALAERLLARGDASGVYMGLPTMATSNGVFERVLDVAPRMVEGPVNLRLAHSRSRSNPAFAAIVERPMGDPLYPSAETEAAVACARWFLSRKRALLGQFGVGTVDQAMQAALFVRHHFVRAFGLATSVVIIDEVHAYDAYMNVILERLLEWLGALHTPTMLLSATLPASRRRALVASYSRGAGFSIDTSTDAGTKELPYPLVTLAALDGVSMRGTPETSESRRVRCELVSTGTPANDLIPQLEAAVRAGGMVAWIRNTVTDAQEAWERACGRGVPTVLFHARMRAIDRERAEREVLRRFGKKGERDGLLLIATQVVEQSLDIDFDLLATDLAPVDLILQRLGRLHRHIRNDRPAAHREARLLVVTPSAEAVQRLDFGRSGFVYDRVTLWLAYDSLTTRAEIVVPSDIRGLVEDSYGPELRAQRIAAAAIASRLAEAETALQERLRARARRAADVCIPPTSLGPAAFSCVEDDDEIVQALTRDGDSTTLLLANWDDARGLGRSIDDRPAWVLDPDSPGAWRVAECLYGETISVPAYPWEWIARGTRSRRSRSAWDRWCTRFESFLAHIGLDHVVVVAVREEAGIFVGTLETNRRTKKLCYERTRGLWFTPEGAA